MPWRRIFHGGKQSRTLSPRLAQGVDCGIKKRHAGLGRGFEVATLFVRFSFLSAMLMPATSGCEKPPMTPNGVVNVFGGVGRGPGAFSYPRAIAADDHGTVLVVDKAGRVQRFDEGGTYLHEWRMPQTAQGQS